MDSKGGGEIAQHHLADRSMSNPIQIFSFEKLNERIRSMLKKLGDLYFNRRIGGRVRSWTESRIVSIDSDRLSIDLF